MYYYIFDPPTGPNDYQRTTQIKDKLTSLGIAGEMSTPMPGRGIPELIQNAVQKRYSTIIAVGGIELINQVARAIEDHDVVLGIIPLHDNPHLDRLIGTTGWEAACDLLKRRRWHSVSLGIISGTGCFLTPAKIVLPDSAPYRLITPDFSCTETGGTIEITPGTVNEHATELMITIDHSGTKPKGGLLSRMFKSENQAPRSSQYLVSQLSLETNETYPIDVAGTTVSSTPAHFTTQPKAVRLIASRSSDSIA